MFRLWAGLLLAAPGLCHSAADKYTPTTSITVDLSGLDAEFSQDYLTLSFDASTPEHVHGTTDVAVEGHKLEYDGSGHGEGVLTTTDGQVVNGTWDLLRPDEDDKFPFDKLRFIIGAVDGTPVQGVNFTIQLSQVNFAWISGVEGSTVAGISNEPRDQDLHQHDLDLNDNMAQIKALEDTIAQLHLQIFIREQLLEERLHKTRPPPPHDGKKKKPHHGKEKKPHHEHDEEEMRPHRGHGGKEMRPHHEHDEEEMRPHRGHGGKEMRPHHEHDGEKMRPHHEHDEEEMRPHHGHGGKEMRPHHDHDGMEMKPHHEHEGRPERHHGDHDEFEHHHEFDAPPHDDDDDERHPPPPPPPGPPPPHGRHHHHGPPPHGMCPPGLAPWVPSNPPRCPPTDASPLAAADAAEAARTEPVDGDHRAPPPPPECAADPSAALPERSAWTQCHHCCGGPPPPPPPPPSGLFGLFKHGPGPFGHKAPGFGPHGHHHGHHGHHHHHHGPPPGFPLLDAALVAAVLGAVVVLVRRRVLARKPWHRDQDLDVSEEQQQQQQQLVAEQRWSRCPRLASLASWVDALRLSRRRIQLDEAAQTLPEVVNEKEPLLP